MKKPHVLIWAAAGLLLAGCSTGPPRAPESNPGANGSNNGLRTEPGSSSLEEPASTPGKYGGKITTANISDPKTLNRWVAAENSSGEILDPMYEALTQLNSYTLKYEPRLAEAPTVSSDGLVYTYKLRDGLVWSDGQPITADDVVFTLDVLYDRKVETISREALLVDVVQPNGKITQQPFKYRKVDERTVEFTLPQRYAPAELMFSFNIAPKHKLEAAYQAGKFNSTWGVDTPVSELVVSGPWTIAEYVPAQRVVFKRNPRYWKKDASGNSLPYLDNFVYLIVPDINTTTLKFRAGETDALAVQAPDYPDVKKREAGGGYQVINRGSEWGFQYLSFNMNPESNLDKNLVALFSDVRFRQAVSHAVDRQRMADDIFLGLAKPLYGPISPSNTAFYNPNIPTFPYDLDKAKALLREIGLTDANNNGVLEFRGKEVRFNILTNTENNLRKSMTTIIVNDLRKIGLGAQFTPINFNDLVRRVDTRPYDWQACVLGFVGGVDPHGGSNIWRSSGPSHQWWPKQKTPATPWEAEIDRLWVQGAQELDPAKRKAIYDRWQQIAAEQQPYIFTVIRDQLTAVRDGFGNIKPASLGTGTSLAGLVWNQEEFYRTNATRLAP